MSSSMLIYLTIGVLLAVALLAAAMAEDDDDEDLPWGK